PVPGARRPAQLPAAGRDRRGRAQGGGVTVRETFVNTTTAALDSDPRIALVLADVSADRFTAAARRHPDRVINVGIREQAMIGIAGGLALSGMRPVVHTDRKSTRLNSSHVKISYAVFCLKKKTKQEN